MAASECSVGPGRLGGEHDFYLEPSEIDTVGILQCVCVWGGSESSPCDW